jgi:UDP-GlcNAc:undecaprenyl-phosphate GlcNAc-1-phosphate transferase
VPRVGGLAMAAGFFIPISLWTIGDLAARGILAGVVVIVLFGFLDDVRELGYPTKFTSQLLAAWMVIFIGELKIDHLGMLLPKGVVLSNWLALPLTFFVIVGVTNAVNLSDGLDGLAGGMMLFCQICIGFLAFCYQYDTITLMSVAICGAIFGFLRFNTHPATVFMGDSGSQLLGFLTVTMALKISQAINPISPLFPLLLLGLPVFDTLSVMFGRISRGDSPFKADKSHLHHKLLKIGFFHSEAVLIVYLLQAGIVTVAFFLRFQSDWFILLAYLGFCAGVTSFFYIFEQKAWQLKRPGRLDQLIKYKLKILFKDRRLIIRLSQFCMEKGFIFYLLITCLLPRSIPRYLTGFVILLLLSMILILWRKPDWTTILLRLSIYFYFPWLIYYGELQPETWFSGRLSFLLPLAFGALLFFTIMTLRTTWRNEGFKATPLDFIILFVAIILPNLPDQAIRNFNIHFLTTKIIVLFFIFEVLLGELRGDIDRFSRIFTAILGAAVVKTVVF